MSSFVLDEMKRAISIFRNMPIAAYSCCMKEGRCGPDQPCICEEIMMNDMVSQITGFSPREIASQFHNRISEMLLDGDVEKYRLMVDELYAYPHEASFIGHLKCRTGAVKRVYMRLRSVRQEDSTIYLYGNMLDAGSLLPEEGMAQISGQEKTKKRVAVQTFGYLNVIIDGKPIVFEHEKARELFALLIDRRGKWVSASEIISCLWESEPVNEYTQGRCRKAVYYLRRTLADCGMEYVLESASKGYRRIRTEMIDCDLYRYLDGEQAARNEFRGAYLTEYSWAEETLAELTFG